MILHWQIFIPGRLKMYNKSITHTFPSYFVLFLGQSITINTVCKVLLEIMSVIFMMLCRIDGAMVTWFSVYLAKGQQHKKESLLLLNHSVAKVNIAFSKTYKVMKVILAVLFYFDAILVCLTVCWVTLCWLWVLSVIFSWRTLKYSLNSSHVCQISFESCISPPTEMSER